MAARSGRSSKKPHKAGSEETKPRPGFELKPTRAEPSKRSPREGIAGTTGGARPEAPREATIEDVAISEIRQADLTFQYRLEPDHKDLLSSLKLHGQREPVDLQGATPPYRIIDGFRRIGALRELGQRTVKAILHNIDDERAHQIAFTKNVARKNLSTLEKAHAVTKAMERGKRIDEIARELNLSAKQVRRYAELGKLPHAVSETIERSGLSMAHAFVLRDFQPNNPEEWAERCAAANWSAKRLRREIKKAHSQKSPMRQRRYVHEEKNYMRVYPCRLSRSMPQEEKDRAIEALRKAVRYLEEE